MTDIERPQSIWIEVSAFGPDKSSDIQASCVANRWPPTNLLEYVSRTILDAERARSAELAEALEFYAYGFHYRENKEGYVELELGELALDALIKYNPDKFAPVKRRHEETQTTIAKHEASK